MFESHRVEQFCCALSSARIAQRGFAVVGSTRACPGPASWSPKVESSCNADNLDFVSIFDGELEDLVPGRRDVSSDIEKLHLSQSYVPSLQRVLHHFGQLRGGDTSQFFASLRLSPIGSETKSRDG